MSHWGKALATKTEDPSLISETCDRRRELTPESWPLTYRWALPNIHPHIYIQERGREGGKERVREGGQAKQHLICLSKAFELLFSYREGSTWRSRGKTADTKQRHEQDSEQDPAFVKSMTLGETGRCI